MCVQCAMCYTEPQRQCRYIFGSAYLNSATAPNDNAFLSTFRVESIQQNRLVCTRKKASDREREGEGYKSSKRHALHLLLCRLKSVKSRFFVISAMKTEKKYTRKMKRNGTRKMARIKTIYSGPHPIENGKVNIFATLQTRACFYLHKVVIS